MILGFFAGALVLGAGFVLAVRLLGRDASGYSAKTRREKLEEEYRAQAARLTEEEMCAQLRADLDQHGVEGLIEGRKA